MLGEALVALVALVEIASEMVGALAVWPGSSVPDAEAQREGIATPASAEERATAPQE